jgi:hypothetical protein
MRKTETTNEEKALQSLFRRARALMERTVERGCTPEEAMSAAAILKRMLDENGLSEEDVKSSSAPFVEVVLDTNDPFRKRLLCLVGVIEDLTGTRGWTCGAGAPEVKFLGREDDAMVANFLWEIAVRALEAGMERQRFGLYRKGIQHRRKMAYADGMAETMHKGLMEVGWTRHKPPAAGTGIVLAKQAAVEEELVRRNIELEAGGQSRSWAFDDAFALGAKDGRDVQFNAGIGAAQTAVLALPGRSGDG